MRNVERSTFIVSNDRKKGSMGKALTRQSRAVSLGPQTFTEAIAFAERIAPTTFVPESYRNRPEEILAAMQYGAELGLGPLQSLNSLTVIKGRVGMYASTMRALVDASGLMEQCDAVFDRDTLTATVTVKRVGRNVAVYSWGEADAKLAGLAGRKMYLEYPERMYKARAMSFALRDEFADVLKGLMGAEEMRGEEEFELSDIVDVGEPTRKEVQAQSVWDGVEPETREQLEKGFVHVGWTEAQRNIKLAEFRGREAELVEVLKQEWRDKNGIKPNMEEEVAKDDKGGAEAESAPNMDEIDWR